MNRTGIGPEPGNRPVKNARGAHKSDKPLKPGLNGKKLKAKGTLDLDLITPVPLRNGRLSALFLPLPAAFLGATAAAGGIALINSLGQIAGFFSPFFVGWIKDVTGGTTVALYVLSALLFFGAMLVLTIPAKVVNR